MTEEAKVSWCVLVVRVHLHTRIHTHAGIRKLDCQARQDADGEVMAWSPTALLRWQLSQFPVLTPVPKCRSHPLSAPLSRKPFILSYLLMFLHTLCLPILALLLEDLGCLSTAFMGPAVGLVGVMGKDTYADFFHWPTD